MTDVDPIKTDALSFQYRHGDFGLENISFALPAGARCLLVGANGAGKSTLLRILGGKHMVDAATVSILGRSPFHDTALVQEMEFLGGGFPFTVDMQVAEILRNAHNVDAARVATLTDVLEVDPAWSMMRVSDGQRRRVQLLLGLMRKKRVYLLDEITTDLDMIGRQRLLDFLRDETTEGATIVYATHIFDGLDRWASHILYLENGRQRRFGDVSGYLKDASAKSLFDLVYGWLLQARNKIPPVA